jgi:hypothetical protein
MFTTSAALCCVLPLLGAGPASTPQIRGDYIEARTADVFTGPCFSNSEVFITGHQAVLAWKVTEGKWDGVDLAGLTVAAAVRGTTTFSEDRPEDARAIVIVDDQASARQRPALVALAKHLGGKRLTHVSAVKAARMSLMVEAHEASSASSERHTLHSMPQAPKGLFWAAGFAEILTRPLDDGDHFCGNEVVAYSPLSRGVDVLPAYTLGNRFQAAGLDTTWNDPNCRSSFVGHFAL